MGGTLVTGFGPFGEFEENPSGIAVGRLASEGGVFSHVFATSVAAVRRQLPALLGSLRPRTVVLFGYADSAHEVRLETLARNRCDGTARDVDGERLPDLVVEGGPPTLASTLPLGELEGALVKSDVLTGYSDDAGGYLCNFSFYLTQHLAPLHGVERSGFVHLPSAERYEAATGRPLDCDEVVARVLTALV